MENKGFGFGLFRSVDDEGWLDDDGVRAFFEDDDLKSIKSSFKSHEIVQ